MRRDRKTGLAVLAAALSLALGMPEAAAQDPSPTGVAVVDPAARAFEVTYVAADALYLNGGSDEGLTEGSRLTLRRREPGAALGEGQRVGEIVVFAVTQHSAACEIVSTVLDAMVGDVAYLTTQDRLDLLAANAKRTENPFAQVVSFTLGDPLQQEMRESRPRPPLPEVNRLRGRVGFEHGSVNGASLPGTSYREGLFLRTDMTRIGGSHWNFTGYWRGHLNSSPSGPQQETLRDLTNRVYHIGLYYDDPDSRWTLGVGRLLVPWASSLNTLDGGYLGRRVSDTVTVGAFSGSTPDPTSWNYTPDRRILGGFVNLDRGSFETTHYSGTAGVAVTRLAGQTERNFLFLENNLQFGRKVSVYENLEADRATPLTTSAGMSGAFLSRHYLTLRVRPTDAVTVDLSHNYFHLAPTFDPRLAGTGLIDDLLFEGFSGGVRVTPVSFLTLYTRLGRSERRQDSKATLNQMYGVVLSGLPARLRLDVRYSIFDGPFGSGTYRSASLTHDRSWYRIEVSAGDQKFDSGVAAASRARYLNLDADLVLSNRIVWGGGASVYRGNLQDYNQIFLSLGYLFGSTARGE
jgi:hypothetical protein